MRSPFSLATESLIARWPDQLWPQSIIIFCPVERCELQIGFSITSLARAENALKRIEDDIREVVTKLDSIQSRIEGMNLDETQLEIETEERKTSLCSVTGLSMISEFEARALPALQLARSVLQGARNKRVTCDEMLNARRSEIDDIRISIKDLEEIAE